MPEQEGSPQNEVTRDVADLNRFLDSIIEYMPAMVFMKDAKDLRFERFNLAGEELLGISRDEMIGKTDHDFFPQVQADHFTAKDRAVLDDKSLIDIPEEPIETPQGKRWLHTKKIPLLDDKGNPTHLLGISLDITDQKLAKEALLEAHKELEQRVIERTAELSQEIEQRKQVEQALERTQAQLVQTQKMEAIGRLAGGIAHDFNNLLSVVLTYSEVLMQQADESEPQHKGLAAIRQAGERAAGLTRQLLAFSRQQVLQPRPLNLNDTLTDMQEMLAALVGDGIELEIRPQNGLSMISADPSQIEQVILNLVVNSGDAMPDGGSLKIVTSDVSEDDEILKQHPALNSEPHVMVTVADTGIGMDKATMSQIFEPFFTTKSKDKGTGLGLAMVFGIVTQSNGSIWCESKPNQGAKFTLLFPAVAAEHVSEPDDVPGDAVELDGTETILLVDDDDQVRELVAEVLRKYGYKVFEVALPSAAIALHAKHADKFDLLLTDVVMPEMEGDELADRLIAKSPALRVLFMSGYANEVIDRHGQLRAGAGFIAKPITPVALAGSVRAVLDREPV